MSCGTSGSSGWPHPNGASSSSPGSCAPGSSYTGVSQDVEDLGAALRKAEGKTESMQARAFALDRLIAEGVLETAKLAPAVAPGSPGANEIGRAVEEQLAALRRRLASGEVEGRLMEPGSRDPS